MSVVITASLCVASLLHSAAVLSSFVLPFGRPCPAAVLSLWAFSVCGRQQTVECNAGADESAPSHMCCLPCKL
eukprot:1156162-Pelagomonas_calceolata.AAC.5